MTYELLDRIGDGGMATVHRAHQRGVGGFDRIVALKRIAPHLEGDPGYVERFIHEARIASAFSHPTIVQIYDFGRDGDGFYIAMEHVEGRSLLSIAREAACAGVAIPIDVAVAILVELADALDHVHTRTGLDGAPLDIIHRDISLANVLVTRAGHVKLIDFGVATGRGFTPPVKGAIVGKPSYMAPETLRGKTIDARIDLYALAVIGWELVAGYPLFLADDDAGTFKRVLHDEVHALTTVRPDCPPELETVLHCALSRDRAARPPTAQVMRMRLEAVARGAGLATGAAAISRWLATEPAPATLDPTVDASTINLPRLVVPAPTPAVLPRAPSRSRLRIAAVAAMTTVAGILAIGVGGSSSASVTPALASVAPAAPARAAHVTIEPIAVPAVITIKAHPPAPHHPAAAPKPEVARSHAEAPPAPVAHHAAPAQATKAAHARVEPPPTFAAFDTLTDSPTLPQPITHPTPPPAPKRLALIRPDRVTKLAGEIAQLPRPIDRVTVLSAVICIDERGAVTTARLIGDVPAWIREPVTRDLRRFTFSPYREDGTVVAACFTRQLSVTGRAP